jgi:hypothetical protein
MLTKGINVQLFANHMSLTISQKYNVHKNVFALHPVFSAFTMVNNIDY